MDSELEQNGVNDMDVQKIAEQYRMGEWSEMVREKRASGQSVKAFCKMIGISENTYYVRQRKVRIAACVSRMAEQRPDEAKVAPTGSVAPASGWAIAEIGAVSCENSSVIVEINGCKIEVTQSTDAELLVKTCRVLRSIC